MAAILPGSAGWAISGDKTIEFAKNPLEFLERRIRQYGSKVFLSRALNKPTVFVTSNHGVEEILKDGSDSFTLGYRDFGYTHNIFGDILLFSDEVRSSRLRSLLEGLFTGSKCKTYFSHCKYVADEFLSDLHEKNFVLLYEMLKGYTTALCLSLFMDVSWRDEEFDAIKMMSTQHWHGLISLPVSIELKGWSTKFGKAMKSKELLLKAIKNKLKTSMEGSFLESVKTAGFQDEEEAANHVLLFVSALIPKALASLLTSFCIAMAGEKKLCLRQRALEDESFLDDTLLEVQRLWPPFLGGRRITTKPVYVDGRQLPEGMAVGFITWMANRDPTVFSDAESFLPDRWKSFPESREYVWTFGGGSRKCIGTGFINRILKISCKKLLSTYNWTVEEDEHPSYKSLPVARPRQSVKTYFALSS